MLQMTYDRIVKSVPRENVIAVTNEAYAGLVAEQLPDLPVESILLEPTRRNTAPCIAWASYHVLARDPEASMIITPSDHLITREEVFTSCVNRGFEFVDSHTDMLLTMGITPVRPETGYGYIQTGESLGGDFMRVKTFTEKPDAELARVFVDSGEFLWNSGIFLWRPDTLIEALRNTAPDLAGEFDKGSDAFGTPREREFIEARFAACPSISIDYAVMEKADNVCVEAVDFGWSDLGTWHALYDLSPKNSDHNVTQNCNVLSYGSSGNVFAVKGEKLIVVEGLKDYIVADADDVLLICPLADEHRIRQAVNDIRARLGEKYL